ncbi:MAG: polysaccharide biosynthesis protein [Bryobacterales bacterium]|nr:polysaccharide biosynthesis protein [Bryobacterales bacterium]
MSYGIDRINPDKVGEVEWDRFIAQPDSEAADFKFASLHAGQCVLITGAGGSIGSALAKALARAGVQRLLLLDSSEINLFHLQQQLDRSSPNVAPEFILGSVDDPALLDSLFRRRPVDMIYHAAAWKQVPLLEKNPFAAIRNNSIGTYTLAQAAICARVPKLVLISTDKAVNPRSIMGVSKRIAELVAVSLASAACPMNAIRLCNVIGSSGSVVPIILRQIALRQPVTITDPRMSRWFLTARHAVEAILACGASPQTGKILLPPVGEPVRIVDLARFLIQSVGNGWPGELAYIGIRPGEKLTEQLIFESERTVGMEGRLTVIKTPILSPQRLSALIDDLGSHIAFRDLPGLLGTIQSTIPEYAPSNQLAGGLPLSTAQHG